MQRRAPRRHVSASCRCCPHCAGTNGPLPALPSLPQRVGYQCSAYYRDVIIPQGLVIDRRFKMTRNGRAVYVG